MKIIDGKDAKLGRLASFVAKGALKGEEFAILNCEQIIITGNRKFIENDFQERRSRVGTVQKGPKLAKTSEKIVKRAIRGMFPDHREGRGREAFKRIKCYNGVPKEFEGKETIKLDSKLIKQPHNKFITVKQVSK